MNTRTTTTLAGPWRFHADPHDRGRAGRWYADMPAPDGALERACTPAGVALWCFNCFELSTPPGAGHEAAVRFDTLPHGAEVWVNGEPLERPQALAGPVVLPIGHGLTQGAQTLALRLERAEQDAAPMLCAAVHIDSRPIARIADLFIQPDIRRKRLTVTVETTAPGSVVLQVEGTTCQTQVECLGEGPVKAMVEFPEFECWSPRTPVLYTLRAELHSDAALADHIESRFGMREFTVKERRFALNSRPCALRGAWLNGDTAAGHDPETVTAFKAAGFNLLRVQGVSVAPAVLARCDEAGMLVWFEPAVEADEDYLRGCLRAWRNHAGLVILSVPGDIAASEAHASTLRAEDASRLLFLPAVHDRGLSARFMRPYHDAHEPCDCLAVHMPCPSERAMEQHCMRNGSPGRLVLFGAAGVSGFEGAPGQIELAFHARGLDAVFGTLDRFQQAIGDLQAAHLRAQVDAARSNAKSSAYCLHLPAGATAEPEPAPIRQALRQAQAPLRLVIECDRTNIAPRDEVRVRVSLVNDLRVEGRADLSIQVVGPTQQVLWKKRRSVRIAKAGDELWTGNLAASGTVGDHRIVARLLQGMNRVAETSLPLHVMAPPPALEVSVGLPAAHPYARAIHKVAPAPKKDRPPIYILPPLANTVRAYPAEHLAEVLGEVAGGAAALVLSPPDDWNDLAEAAGEPSMQVTSVSVSGGLMGACHYAKRHPVFNELPARGLMGAPYRNVVPLRAFLEESEDDICGCLDGAALAATRNEADPSPWRSDILVRRVGQGRLIFTHLRLLEHLDHDPVAARLLSNLLSHYASRAVLADDTPRPNREALQWLTREQATLRRWMVLGMLPNFDEAGHDTAYPPEAAVDLEGVYPGWYRAVSWKRWYTTAGDDHALDLAAATGIGGVAYAHDEYGTVYAYTEFTHAHRDAVYIHLAERHATKLWLNGRLLFATRGQPGAGKAPMAQVDAALRQGKNTVLLKISKTPGPLAAHIDFEAKDGRPLNLRWWRG